jgi:chromate transporter
MIPIMQRELVDKQQWLHETDFIDMVGLTQSVPGPIAVNAAVYLGYRLRGLAGATVAVIGVALPSLLTILTIAWALSRYNLDWLNRAFVGIRPTVVALIAYAAYTLGKRTIASGISWLLLVGTVVAVSLLGLHPALTIAVGAVVGLAIRREQTRGVEQ